MAGILEWELDMNVDLKSMMRLREKRMMDMIDDVTIQGLGKHGQFDTKKVGGAEYDIIRHSRTWAP